MTLDLLLNLIPPPSQPIETGTPEEWSRIENALGTKLPQDYKDFIDTYGTGQIAEFLWIHNPFSADEYVNLIQHQIYTQSNNYIGILASTGQEIKVEYPYPIYPEPNGLLKWGTTDNGDDLYWQTTGGPDDWPVVTDEVRGTGFAIFSESMTSFIAKAILGEIHSEVLPAEIFSENRQFDVGYDD